MTILLCYTHVARCLVAVLSGPGRNDFLVKRAAKAGIQSLTEL